MSHSGLGEYKANSMVSKQKINRERVQAALNTHCPKCGYSIPPAEIRRIDFDKMQCPACGESSPPDCGTTMLRPMVCRAARSTMIKAENGAEE
jgi:predicted RNA-binding Zn-ribbon protein involved in translation (DUF1610 family)